MFMLASINANVMTESQAVPMPPAQAHFKFKSEICFAKLVSFVLMSHCGAEL